MLTKSNKKYEEYTLSAVRLVFYIKLFAKNLFN